MKKILAGLGVSTILFGALVVSALAAKPADVPKGPMPKATGDVWMSGPSQQMMFNAHDYGSSGLDKGEVEYWNYDAGLNYTANVFCANVYGSSTNFAYQIPDGNFVNGLFIVFKVTDGGTPGTNSDTVGFNIAANYDDALAQCNDTALSTSNNYPVTAGNLVVHTY